MKPKIRVLVIERIPLLQRGIKRMLERNLHYDAEEAPHSVGVLETVALTNFDIIIVGISSETVKFDKELVRQIKVKLPAVHILILSDNLEIDLISMFYNAGASGILDKHCNEKLLMQHMTQVLNQGYSFDESLRTVLEEKSRVADEQRSVFSARELEIARLWCQHLTVKEISLLLGIAANTVSAHKRTIYQKTHTHSKNDLRRFLEACNLF